MNKIFKFQDVGEIVNDGVRIWFSKPCIRNKERKMENICS